MALVVACGSETSGAGGGDGGSSGTFNKDGGPDSGDPYANDPPPPWCGPSGQPEPPKPGGTPDCPDDKNKPGCGCTTPGEKAPCWTGLRANRNLGVCKDGVTECKKSSEVGYVWGDCEGQVLPTQGATLGPSACMCFSKGQWKLANISPCFMKYCTIGDCAENSPTRTDTNLCERPGMPGTACDSTTGPCQCVDSKANNASSGTNGTWALSTIMTGPGASQCPAIGSNTPPPAAPGSAWSTTRLAADCAGHFTLCYTLKAGDYANPKADDCVLAKKCVENDLAQANVEQDWGDLGAWTTSTAAESACADKFGKTGGYGEMSVLGKSVRCDVIDDGKGGEYMFNRVKYCPRKCQGGQNPTDPECQGCQAGGSGTFP